MNKPYDHILMYVTPVDSTLPRVYKVSWEGTVATELVMEQADDGSLHQFRKDNK